MKACTTPRTMLGADCVRRKGKEGTGTICRQPFVVFLDLWGKDSHFGLMKLKRTLSCRARERLLFSGTGSLSNHYDTSR